MSNAQPLKVFLAHASQDKFVVRELYDALKSEGWIDPWLDKAKILPGQDWEMVIEKAVDDSDVIIVCLSNQSVSKEGFVQKEIRYAFDIALEKPEGATFLIPLRLDDCNIPRRLRSIHWVDYFGTEKKEAYTGLLRALRLRYDQKIKSGDDLAYQGAVKKLTREQLERISAEKVAREKAEREAAEKILLERAEREKREKIAEGKAEKRKDEKVSIWEYILVPFAGIASFIYTGIESFTEKRKSNALQEKFSPYPNPYIAGNPIDPISNRSMFFGRSDIVQMISREIKEPSQKPSLLLYGRRRMGKTSALLNLGRFIRDFNIIHIFISAQDIKYRTDSELTFNLIKQVIEKLREAAFVEKLFDNQAYYMSEKNYKENPIHVLSSFFQDCHAFLEKNNYYCLFMFDEYELLGETISRNFFLQIRDTMQHKPRFVFLFAGSHMPNEVRNSNWVEVFMNVKVLPISFLDRKDSYKLLTEPVPNLKYANQKLVNQILDVTGCQPLLMQAMATEIINRLNIIERDTVDENVVNYAIEKTLDAWGFNFFTHLWENDCDTRVDKELLKKIALNNSSTKKSAIGNYASSLKKLKERELLKEDGEYVKLTMPIIKRWIQRENPTVQ